MLTSYFSTSKLSNLLFSMGYLLVFLLMARWESFSPFIWGVFFKEFLMVLVVLASLLAFNFIARKNILTQHNGYKTLFLATLSCLLLPALQNSDLILANFFCLLAIRRIISLKSQQDSIKKIFDASFLICIASLFYFWSILFLFLVYCGVFIHLRRYGNLYLIPMLAVFSVAILVTQVDLLLTDTFYTIQQWVVPSNLDFSAYSDPAVFIPVSIIIALTLWPLFFYLGLIRRASGHNKSSFQLVLIWLLIAFTVAFMGETKDGGELLFLIPPMAIVLTNYVQNLGDKWFREMILLLAILAPVGLLLFL